MRGKHNDLTIAAAGDLHIGYHDISREALNRAAQAADLFLLAGDLTMDGRSEEIQKLRSLLSQISIPVLAVLGNHDHHGQAEEQLFDLQKDLENLNILEGQLLELQIKGKRIAVLGIEGFGGGFENTNAESFNPDFIAAWDEEADRQLESIGDSLEKVRTGNFDLTIAVVHYVPFSVNLGRECTDVEFLLGSARLGAALKDAGFDLVVHGHAHLGDPGLHDVNGTTRVANVALEANDMRFSEFKISADSNQLTHSNSLKSVVGSRAD